MRCSLLGAENGTSGRARVSSRRSRADCAGDRGQKRDMVARLRAQASNARPGTALRRLARRRRWGKIAGGGGLGAAADGSTLKVTAPTPVAPMTDVQVENRRPSLVAGNSIGRFVSP